MVYMKAAGPLGDQRPLCWWVEGEGMEKKNSLATEARKNTEKMEWMCLKCGVFQG